MTLNNKQRKTLELIFTEPTPASINWQDIESLFIALGAIVTEGKGSRIRLKLNEVKATFHKPHDKESSQGAVKSVRDFLKAAGIEP